MEGPVHHHALTIRRDGIRLNPVTGIAGGIGAVAGLALLFGIGIRAGSLPSAREPGRDDLT